MNGVLSPTKPGRSPRMLIVTQDFPPDEGGIQTYCLELARALIARGREVRVLCPAVGRRHAADRELPVARVPFPGSLLALPLLALMPSFVRRHRITHVLYAQWQTALWHLLWPGQASRLATACLVHGRELVFDALGPPTRRLRPRVFGTFDLALPVSRRVRELLVETTRPRCRVELLHPAVDPEVLHPVPAGELRRRLGLGDAPVVVSLGRLAARKNLGLLLAALPGLRRRVPGVRLVVAGEGPEAPALRAQAAALGLGEAVLFVGRVPDAERAAYYSLGDVFAFPSRETPGDIEGFGIAPLEAAACGVPAVATRSGGVPDAVADGETGLLVPDGDAAALADALTALLGDPARRREMGARARRRVETAFTWARVAERLESLWCCFPPAQPPRRRG